MTNPLTKFLTEVEGKLEAAQAEPPENSHLSSIHFGGASEWLKQRRADMRIKDAASESLPTYLKRLVEICRVQDEALAKIESNHNVTVMNHDEAFMDGAHVGYFRQAESAKDARQRVTEMLR